MLPTPLQIAECTLCTMAMQASSEALTAAREALKAARAESAQRLAAVQGLQAQLARATAELTVPAVQLAEERAARERDERNLAQAKNALMHRSQLIDELRKRVGPPSLLASTCGEDEQHWLKVLNSIDDYVGGLQVHALTEEREQGMGMGRLADLQAQCAAGSKALAEQRVYRAELETRCKDVTFSDAREWLMLHGRMLSEPTNCALYAG